MLAGIEAVPNETIGLVFVDHIPRPMLMNLYRQNFEPCLRSMHESVELVSVGDGVHKADVEMDLHSQEFERSSVKEPRMVMVNWGREPVISQ